MSVSGFNNWHGRFGKFRNTISDPEEALQRTNEELEIRIEYRTNELKQTLEALEREREILSMTLTSIEDAVITTDIQSRIISLNPFSESLTK